MNTRRLQGSTPLIFPGLWLLTLVLVCAIRLNVALAGLVTFVLGASLFLLSDRSGTLKSKATLLTAILMASFLITRLYYWVTWNPIGTIDDGWGVMPGIQDVVREWPGIPCGARHEVSMRRTSSGLLSVTFPSSYFVFLRSPGKRNNGRNLIFRYFATDTGWDVEPRIDCKSPEAVVVDVGAGDILEVTKQSRTIDGTDILYRLGSSKYPAALAFWQRPFLWTSGRY